MSIVETTADGDRLAPVVVANAATWELFPWQADDWPVVVDCQDRDFDCFIEALQAQDRARTRRLGTYDLGNDESVLLVHWVAVDPFWRGAGLGPQFLCQSVFELIEDPPAAILLKPSPFPTVSDECGPAPDWEGPRRGRTVLRSVRASWRTVGFQPLCRGAWFRRGPMYDLYFGELGNRELKNLDQTTNNPATRAWLAETRTRQHP